MRSWKKVIGFAFLCIFIFTNLQVASVRGIEKEKNNIILLIDNSYSMRNTDPQKLSLVASSLLIDSIDDNTDINVIGFGSEILSPSKLDEKPSKSALKSFLSQFKFDNRGTNLREGLEEALAQLSKVQGNKTIIVLSDGKEDPEGGVTKEHTDKLNNAIENLSDTNVKVHCIGLSSYADKDMLGNISGKTGGDYWYCDKPSEMLKVFGDILGNLNNFNTIDTYTTDKKAEKEFKLSKYIDEIIIKVASSENKTPRVDVFKDGVRIGAEKEGELYKIFKIKNQENSDIKITSGDNCENLVIVQVKRIGKINIDSTQQSFTIPSGVPLDINASLDLEEQVDGLHMDVVEENVRKPITDSGDKNFKFIFNKSKSAEYPIIITAYDGDGNIIAVKNLEITVTDKPAFYYVNPIPAEVVAESNFRLELKQLDNSKVDTPSGYVILESSNKKQQIPLKLENGLLMADISLSEEGEYKFTCCINGIKNNESFAYFLPYKKLNVIKKPFVNFKVLGGKELIKGDNPYKLQLEIEDSLLYKNETIQIYDVDNNKLGEFQVDEKSKGKISVEVSKMPKGKNLTFILKGNDGLQVSERVDTKITCLSGISYYLYYFRIPIIIVLVIGILALIFFSVGIISFNKNIRMYSIQIEGEYFISRTIPTPLCITLNYMDRRRYLNLYKNTIEVEDVEGLTIGELTLKFPFENKYILGWWYIKSKDNDIRVEYKSIMEQEASKEGSTLGDIFDINEEININIRDRKRVIKINFS